jgi:hypothetical protein
MALSNRVFALLAEPFHGGDGPTRSTINLVWASGDATEYLGDGNKLDTVLNGLKYLRDGRPDHDLPPDHSKLVWTLPEL